MALALVTGGCGYIGTHACIALLEGGWEVIVIDNLSNNHPEALRRVRDLAGGRLEMIEGDVLDLVALDSAFARGAVDAVIHLAGRKAVGESVTRPISYYETNLAGTVELLKAMERHAVKDLVFSSSCECFSCATSTR